MVQRGIKSFSPVFAAHRRYSNCTRSVNQANNVETQTPKGFIDITRFCIAIACLLAKFIVLAINGMRRQKINKVTRVQVTFLRSSTTQQRLNNLFLPYVHTARTDSLDLVSVAKEFVSSNSRRLNYFGKF